MASPDLIWALTSKSSCFLRKSNGLFLSTEPNNLMNKHSFKFSGICNDATVGITESARGV